MRWCSVVAVLLMGCIHDVSTELVTSTRPTTSTSPGQAVNGQTCNAWALYLVPVLKRDQASVATLVEELAGDEYHALVGVTVETRKWNFFPFAYAHCTYVSGRVVLVE